MKAPELSSAQQNKDDLTALLKVLEGTVSMENSWSQSQLIRWVDWSWAVMMNHWYTEFSFKETGN
jgi:hypothetical protein